MAIPELATLLHVGREVTFVEYLFRVGVYLIAFGGIAGLTYGLAELVDPSQSWFAPGSEGEEGEQ